MTAHENLGQCGTDASPESIAGKRTWTPPAIVHEERLEAIAALCPTPGKSAPPCNPLNS